MKLCIFLISIFSLSYGVDFVPSTTAKSDTNNAIKEMSNDSLLYFYTWGLAPRVYANDCEKQLQKEYGFAYKVVAGCVVSTEQMLAWSKHNKAIRTSLEEKWGTDWEKTFNHAVELCRENQQE